MRAANRVGIAGVLIAAVVSAGSTVGATTDNNGRGRLSAIDHIVVIYEENHSFDNLFGSWPGVNGLNNKPGNTPRNVQVDTTGTPLSCLLQKDVNLTSPPLPGTDCTLPDGSIVQSAFPNAPFKIDDFIKPEDTTCPTPANAFSVPNGVLKGSGLPGGCTRDLVHKFYQEQYQIDGGKMDRYTVGSDAAGLTQGFYDTKQLPVYKYLHGPNAPKYAILDDFFQAAFGGSFLNHQWLIAAATPVYPDPLPTPDTLHSIIDADGFPANYPPLHPTTGLRDGVLTVACNADGTPPAPARVCGNYAVNTMQPTSQPRGSFGAVLPTQHGPTIGDELTAANVSWAWYSGGWDNATGNTAGAGYTNGPGPTCGDPNALAGSTYPACPDALFQFHHQPFNYYANYAPGTSGRSHLKDEADFRAAVTAGQLPAVSFVKPVGEENEHPGYASQANGNDHLVDLLQAIESGPQAKSTMVVVTYDEFGGQWDHVKPPTQKKVSDAFGPGTRIPAIVIAPNLPEQHAVDSAEHDTTSILATIEHRFGLKPLSSRDAAVNDLATVYHDPD
jgi:phospholipase C